VGDVTWKPDLMLTFFFVVVLLMIMVVAGTSKINRPSMIMAMKVPLTSDTPPLPCLSGPVTRMCSSFDGSHVFVAGSDGCLIIYEVKEKDFAGKSLGAMGRDDTTGRPIYAQEILVTRTDIEEQASAMREMQSKVVSGQWAATHALCGWVGLVLFHGGL